ncbi:MAG: germination protein YpeB [Eubacteriaceae bacterium]|nr:germination protein YpeB [Eubacteriaceae bacterium]
MRKNIAIILLSAALVAVSVWGYMQEGGGIAAGNSLENSYKRDYQVFADTTRSLAENLGKGSLGTDEAYMALNYVEAAKLSGMAGERLSNLPLSQQETSIAASFLAKTNDFSMAMVRKHLDGEQMTEEDFAASTALAKTAQMLSASISSFTEESSANKDFSWSSIGGEMPDGSPNAFAQSLSSIEHGMGDYPEMVYDGQYSDHLKDAKPKGLTGDEATSDSIMEKLQADNPELEFKFNSETKNSGIDSFNFSTGDDEDYRTFNFSKTGGHLLSSTSSKAPSSTKISMDEAREKAQAFLEGMNVGPMETRGDYDTYDNIALFSFCCLEGDVKCYPDVIKVQVSLEDGKVIGYNASEFYQNHLKRDASELEPMISPNQAKEKLSGDFEVQGERLSVINSKGHNEQLCYEFTGKKGDGSYQVFIDAKNGAQRNALQVFESETSVYSR